jgi:hypothetical protein
VAAKKYDKFKIEQGADLSIHLTWKDGTGALIDLTGWSARMMVRKSYKTTTPVLDFRSGAGGTAGTAIALGGALGTIDITATNAVTSGVPSGDYVYDLEMVSPGGIVTRLLEGIIPVSPEATR